MTKLLLLFAFILIPATCAAQTTVRVVGGAVEEAGSIWVLLEIRSDQQISSLQGTLSYPSSRVEPTSYDVGNAIVGWGGNAVSEVSFTAPGRIGFSLRMQNGNYMCCSGHYDHFLSIRLHVLTGGGPISLGFDDSVLAREVRRPSGTLVNTSWVGADVNVIGPGVGRTLRYDTTKLVLGETSNVPVFLDAKGGENSISFTFLRDSGLIFVEEVTRGADALGASLITSTVGTWRTGVALALPHGQGLAPGPRHLLTLKLRPPIPSLEGVTQLWFSDDPVDRALISTTGQPLPMLYGSNIITVKAGIEGDVSPRPDGNGTTSLQDYVQIGRFAAGLDPWADGLEFIKADCAPISTLGDGRISLADFVQAGRYAAKLDSFMYAGGPTKHATSIEHLDSLRTTIQSHARLPEHTRTVLLNPVPSRKGDLTYAVELRGEGDENAVSFSLEYTGSMKLVLAEPDDPGASFHVSQSVPGKIGVILAMPPGLGLSRRLLTLRFEGKGEVRFGEGPVAGELVNVDAEEVAVVFGTNSKLAIP